MSSSACNSDGQGGETSGSCFSAAWKRLTVRSRQPVRWATISLIDQPPATSGCVILASPISSSKACQEACSWCNSARSWILLREVPILLSFHRDLCAKHQHLWANLPTNYHTKR